MLLPERNDFLTEKHTFSIKKCNKMALFNAPPYNGRSEETQLLKLWEKIDCVFLVFEYLELEEIYKFLVYVKHYTPLDTAPFKTYRFFSKILKKCRNLAYPINFPSETEKCPDVLTWIRNFQVEKELDCYSLIQLWDGVSRSHADAKKLFKHWTGVPMNSFFKIKRIIKQENDQDLVPLKIYHDVRFAYLFSREAQHNFFNSVVVAFNPKNSVHQTSIKIWGLNCDTSTPNPAFISLEGAFNNVISSPKEKILLLFHDVIEPTLNITFLYFETNEIYTGKVNVAAREPLTLCKIVLLNEQSFLLETTFAITLADGRIKIYEVRLRNGEAVAEAITCLHLCNNFDLLPIFSGSDFFKQQTIFMKLPEETEPNSRAYLSAIILQCESDHYPHAAQISLNIFKKDNFEIKHRKSAIIRGGTEMALISLVFDETRKTILLLFLSDGDAAAVETYKLKYSKDKSCLKVCPDFESSNPFRGDRGETAEVLKNKLSKNIELNEKLSDKKRVFSLEKLSLATLEDNSIYQNSRYSSLEEQNKHWKEKGLNKRINAQNAMQLVVFELELSNFKKFLEAKNPEKEKINYNLKFLYTFPPYMFRFSPLYKHFTQKKWLQKSSFLDPIRFARNCSKIIFKEVHFLKPRIREGYLVISVENNDIFFPLVAFFTSLHFLKYESPVFLTFNSKMSKIRTFSKDLNKMCEYNQNFRGRETVNKEIAIYQGCECLNEMIINEEDESVIVHK